jgi:hypothetical protein
VLRTASALGRREMRKMSGKNPYFVFGKRTVCIKKKTAFL